VDHFDAERDPFPYEGGHFDLVIAGEILEHMIYDPMHLLLESRRVLREGGTLLITTPNVASITSVANDSAAMEILFTSAIGLGHLAMMVVRRLGLKDLEFPLVKCGGVFGKSRKLDALLDSVVTSGALRAKVSYLEISPAVGAARIAARLSESPSQVNIHGA